MAQQTAAMVLDNNVRVVSVSNGEEEESNPDEDGSFCYESDYEYNDEDSEDEGGDEPCFVGLKRKTPASVSLSDITCPNSKSTKGGLKTTGLSYSDTSASLVSFPSSSTPQPLEQGDRTECGICKREEHTPVLDCSMITDWLEISGDRASGILAVDQACIQACMGRRVRECHQRLAAMQEEYQDVPAEIFDRSEEIVAVDLRRYHWNVENWQAAFRRRAELENQLRNPRPYGANAAQLQQAIDRLGLDENAVAVNAEIANLPYDNAVQRVQQDHEDFLRRTMDAAVPPAPLAPPRLPAARSRGAAAAAAMGIGAAFRRRTVGRRPMSVRFSRNTSAAAVADNEGDSGVTTNSPADIASAARDETNTYQMDAEEEDVKMRTLASASPDQMETEAEEDVASAPHVEGGEDTGDADTIVPAAAAAGTDDDATANLDQSQAPSSNETNGQTDGGSSSFVSNYLVKPLAKMMGLQQDTTERDNSQNPPAAEGKDAGEEAEAQADEEWACEICMDDEVDEEDRLSMECGHEYCRDCWAQFITGLLDDVRAVGGVLHTPAYCPHRDCRRKITRQHVQRLAPERVLKDYDDMALNSFLQGHSGTMRWCPGPNCDHVVVHSRRGLFLHDRGEVDRFAKCDYCNTKFCFDCGDAPHPDRACLRIYDEGEAANAPDGEAEGGEGTPTEGTPGGGQARGRLAHAARPGRQLQQLQEAERQENKTDKKIRHCPSCNVPIEKNGGCNHMRCKCGHEFCWLCMTATNGLHGMHWCGREPGLGDEPRRGRHQLLARPQPPAMGRMDLDYVTETMQQPEFHCSPEAVKNMLLKRQALNRFAHYYNRHVAHEQGQVFAENQCECLAGRAIDFSRVSEIHSGTDTDFFHLANQRLVASRRMLKYTYAFLYYKLESSSSEEDSGGFEDNECPVDSANSSSLPTYLALFLEHQERLERMTEQLSFLSEAALSREDRKRVVDMTNTVERCMQSVTALSFEERDAKSSL